MPVRRTPRFYAFLIATLVYPPFLTAIRNFSVLYFQRVRSIFNFIHLRLEIWGFYAFSRFPKSLATAWHASDLQTA